MKRYDLVDSHAMGAGMEEHPEGDYVRWDDVSAEIEQWRSAARELINGSDRKTGSAGQVYVDEGSLMALKRLLPTKDCDHAAHEYAELISPCPKCGAING